MRKITEIYIEKEYLKSERDPFGNRIKVSTIGRFQRQPIYAGHWLRIAHYLVDLVVITGITFVLGMLIAIISPLVFETVASPFFYVKLGFTIQYDLLSLIVVFLYYFALEATLQRSVGKFVTGTVVIDDYANTPTKSAIMIRSVSRLIPFEALSCLGATGWHDRFSQTYVVKASEAEALRKLLSDPNTMQLSDSDQLLD